MIYKMTGIGLSPSHFRISSTNFFALFKHDCPLIVHTYRIKSYLNILRASKKFISSHFVDLGTATFSISDLVDIQPSTSDLVDLRPVRPIGP